MGKEARTGQPRETWLVVGILLLLLGLAVALLYVGWWSNDGDTATTTMFGGYVAMTFGVVVSLVFSIGLMSLIYFGKRHGRDF